MFKTGTARSVLIPLLDLSKRTSRLFTVPFSRDAEFVDRVSIFEKIDEQMRTQNRVALSGIGGIG